MKLDDPATTLHRRELLRRNQFLRRIYQDWYAEILQCLPDCEGSVLELGSGPGFLSELIPEVITSEILPLPHVSLVLDARQLPIANAALRGIVMTDVLHHIANVRLFLEDATRAVRPGGVIAMIEPWRTAWSQWIYQRFHHEPFRPDAKHWEFPSAGPLSSANGALPWILFHRDRQLFLEEFPAWSIETVRLTMPFRYLLSGGFTSRSLQPAFTHAWWRGLERVLEPWNETLAMFAFILLRRTQH